MNQVTNKKNIFCHFFNGTLIVMNLVQKSNAINGISTDNIPDSNYKRWGFHYSPRCFIYCIKDKP